ncbi:MAG: fibronectin type III domain-containing protein, partial [Chloroflexi bacterium]|nr:fibronectin type III domain-containing protein [Chloroflexota bacterium]
PGGDSAAVSLAARTLVNPPSAPTSLTTSGITQTAITLNWTKSATATSYEVNGGALTQWTDVGDVATYTFTGLTADTAYTLQVRATNPGGDSAAVSLAARTLVNPPAAPTSLTTSGITQTAITLSWTKSAGATSYDVQGGALSSWTDVGDVATYQFTGLTADTPQSLLVRASNAGGDSGAVFISARTLVNPPAAPTSLTTSDFTPTGITLSWTKSTGATAYKVRKASGDAWTNLNDVATYSFTGLTANTAYTLQVLASNAGGDSAPASLSASTLPAVPTGLTTSGITQTAITLNWTKSAGATSYEVQGGTLSSWTDVGDVATYTFSGLTANTQYNLQVRAKNSDGTTAGATTAARTLAQESALSSPSGVNTSGITQTSITLNWTKVSAATSYEVSGGALTAWTDTGDVATYTFSGLTADTAYTLQVRAKDSQRTSAAVSVSEETLPDVDPPQNVQTNMISDTQIDVEWMDPIAPQSLQAQAAMGYQVRGGKVSSWTSVGSINSYVFDGLDANTPYILQVRTEQSGVYSPSAEVSARTLPQSADSPVQPPPTSEESTPSVDDADNNRGSGSASADAVVSEQPTPSGTAFKCTDEQKAMIAISPQPPGLHVQCVGPDGVGDPSLVARGVVMGVDVWGWVRDFEVCFKPAGDVVFLDASYSPRRLSAIGLYSRAGMICAQMTRPGTLVLMTEASSVQPPAAATISPTTAPRSASFSNCRVQTLDNINFRATPGGQVILVLGRGITLTAYEKQGDWYNADFYGRRGWLHADYVRPIGDCG